MKAQKGVAAHMQATFLRGLRFLNSRETIDHPGADGTSGQLPLEITTFGDP
jgi:hypothetical protein